MKLTDSAFTPSELILLNGDKFAPEVESDGHQLLCSDGMVNGHYLAVMMTAAAILANEEEGALVLELREQKKKLFSSASTSRVFIRPVGQSPSWNGYTLESAILFTAGQFFAIQGDNSVRSVVYSVLMENRKYPWQKIIEFVEWGLATSNWLMPVEGDAATAFQTPFICPDKVQELAFAQPLGPVKQLFTTCKKITPELWQQLLAEIDMALKERVGK
ncbi:MAG: hypothetical protein ACYDH2_10345 [Anaerolineaceae bacterium]|nr:hypothetical protein [Anaerolineaceae bacterium]